MQTRLQEQGRKDPEELRSKIVLLVLLLLGAALIAGGLWGMRQYQASGFDQENAYKYINSLSNDIRALYHDAIQPITEGFDQKESDALTEAAVALLRENWSSAVKEDKSARVDADLSGLSGAALQEKALKLLSVSYAMSGPKVVSAEKKEMAKWTAAQRTKERTAMLHAVTDESAELSEFVQGFVGDKTGT